MSHWSFMAVEFANRERLFATNASLRRFARRGVSQNVMPTECVQKLDIACNALSKPPTGRATYSRLRRI